MIDSSETNQAQPSSPRFAWRSRWLPWLVVLILLALLAVVAWQWFELRSKVNVVQNSLARHMAESNVVARQTEDSMLALQGRVGELESKLGVAQQQQATLENLFRDLSSNREERLFAEVEQGVVLAAQQLQLAANVTGAVAALQAADERLAGNESPPFINLRKVLVRDLDRLRALPQVDVPGMSARLESVLAAVDGLPLASDARPDVAKDGAGEKKLEPKAEAGTGNAAGTAPAVKAATNANANANTNTNAGADPNAAGKEAEAAASPLALAYWKRVGSDVWHELRGLIRIQRFDHDAPALLAPGQAFFLRENIKLRLLSARLALLARDQATFRGEVKLALAMVERYYDGREKAVTTVRDTLAQLASAELSIDVPNIEESLTAIRNFKSKTERK